MRADARWASIPVIAVSAFAAHFSATGLGVEQFLGKPITWELLLDGVRRHAIPSGALGVGEDLV